MNLIRDMRDNMAKKSNFVPSYTLKLYYHDILDKFNRHYYVAAIKKAFMHIRELWFSHSNRLPLPLEHFVLT